MNRVWHFWPRGWPPLSLRQTLILGAGLGILLPAAVLAYFQITSKFKRDVDLRVRAPMHLHANVLSHGMAVAIWTLDSNLATELMDAVMNNPDVVNITVMDEYQEVFARKQRATTPEAELLREERDIVYNGARIGRLAIELSVARVKQELWGELVKQGAALAAQVGFSFLLIWFLFERRVVRPLRTLQDEVSRLARGEFDQPLRWHRKDELGELARGLDLMRLDLATLIAERVHSAELETANKELEAFSYSVSHDLRAPLRGVDGYARMLQEDYGDRLDAEGKRLIEVVRSEAKRMGCLIDDLLSFSRMSRQSLENAPVDMAGLARAVFEGLTSGLPGTIPRFELQPLPPALGDLAMLRQVWVNLLGNAVKFSSHQPAPVIEAGFTRGAGETTYYVKDNGAGFDQQYAHKLFGVFQRLHTEAEFQGTGLGLALVQRVIHRHGGRVWAEGKPGAGATFYFTLPTPKESTQ